VNRTLVQEVMTTPVVTATEAMLFRDLAALLYARDIAAVPVVAPAGHLLGVVSRPDLIPKTAGLAAAAGLCPRFGSRRRERRRARRTTDRPAQKRAGIGATGHLITVARHQVNGLTRRRRT
jgi:CBS domain